MAASVQAQANFKQILIIGMSCLLGNCIQKTLKHLHTHRADGNKAILDIHNNARVHP